MEQRRTFSGSLSGAVFLVAVLVIASFSACTRQEGRPIPLATVMAFKPGTTTEKEVLKKLGPPESKQMLLGEELWTYRHVLHKGFASVNTRVHVLRLRFDDRGILQSVEQKDRKYQSLF
jgi:outer membrane protein assembly factor BamE (lipoprotein component of BamABCDE complex)